MDGKHGPTGDDWIIQRCFVAADNPGADETNTLPFWDSGYASSNSGVTP